MTTHLCNPTCAHTAAYSGLPKHMAGTSGNRGDTGAKLVWSEYPVCPESLYTYSVGFSNKT